MPRKTFKRKYKKRKNKRTRKIKRRKRRRNKKSQKGKHTRAVIGVKSLPLGAMIEIESLFEIN